MAAVIVRKKDVERLGKELVKEIFDFLHDEYILSNFEEMKEKQKKFLRKLVLNEFKHFNITEIRRENSLTVKYGNYDENKFEDDLKCLKDKVKNGSINTSVISYTLNDLDLDMEIDEDLYFKTKAFLNLFKVIDVDYTCLEE